MIHPARAGSVALRSSPVTLRSQCPRALRGLLIGGLLVLASACGGGGSDGGTTAPPPSTNTATFSGSVVDEERNGAAIAGARVAIGSLSTTTTQAGTFTLASVPQGAAHVTVSAAGFDTTTWDIELAAGTTTRTIPLGPTNTYVASGNTLVYVPFGVATVRGAIVVVYGGTSDSKPLLFGNLDFYTTLLPSGDVTRYRAALRTFARANSYAVVGVNTSQATAAVITQGLTAAGSRSNRPELANAPLILEGMSSGGCRVNRIVEDITSRVIAFVSMKYDVGCGIQVASPAVAVPGYLIIGSADAPTINAGVTADFEASRARGAIWSLAVEQGVGHTWSGYHEQIFNWIGAVANLRLPSTVTTGAPVTLRAVTESSGWLGDRTSFAVAGFPCFAGDKPKASWLPSESTARDWQMIVRGSLTTVLICS